MRFGIHVIWLALILNLFLPESIAAQKAGQPGTYSEVQWDALVPASWHPEKMFEGVNIGEIPDGDPRLNELLEKFNQEWRNAPANAELNGRFIKIPGYVAPLDWESYDNLKEFLLVPYFGACIHSPPPPANQIIYVKVDKRLKGVRSMDVVWVYGQLTVESTDSGDMGASSYSLKADKVDKYQINY